MTQLLTINPAVLLGTVVLALVAVRALYKLLGSPWSVVAALALVAALVFGTGCDVHSTRRADRTYTCNDDTCTLTLEVARGSLTACRCWQDVTIVEAPSRQAVLGATNCRCE